MWINFFHDDVIKWKQFSRYWPFVRGIHQSPGNSATRSFDVFLYLRLNKRLNIQSWDWWFETPSHSSWRYCNTLIAAVLWFIHNIIMDYLYMYLLVNICERYNDFKETMHGNKLNVTYLHTHQTFTPWFKDHLNAGLLSSVLLWSPQRGWLACKYIQPMAYMWLLYIITWCDVADNAFFEYV